MLCPRGEIVGILSWIIVGEIAGLLATAAGVLILLGK